MNRQVIATQYYTPFQFNMCYNGDFSCFGSNIQIDEDMFSGFMIVIVVQWVNNSNVSLLTVKIIPQRIGVWILIVSH